MSKKIPNYEAILSRHIKLARKETRKKITEYAKDLREKLKTLLASQDHLTFTRISVSKKKHGEADFGIRDKKNALLILISLSNGKISVTKSLTSKEEVFSNKKDAFACIKKCFK
ncbi:MAG: hypothetical protein JWM20_801 [Patescibacteria group bacterium]|nr:hypothetical protein [Patescibacteria group bacterium]